MDKHAFTPPRPGLPLCGTVSRIHCGRPANHPIHAVAPGDVPGQDGAPMIYAGEPLNPWRRVEAPKPSDRAAAALADVAELRDPVVLRDRERRTAALDRIEAALREGGNR